MARLLREHPAVARAARFGSHTGLGRPDRRSEDGSTHREWPVPRPAARTRPTARPSAQPSLLGTSPSLRRPARDPIFESASDPGDAVASGDLDVAYVPPAAVPAVRRQPGLRLVAPISSSFEQLTVQLGPNAHPALRDKLVRRALAYGIDRTALVRQILGVPSARALDSAVHLPPSRYYQPNWSAYRYRPAEARRLLGQAGCRRGADRIFSCGGERLSLRFVTTASPFRAQEIALMQAQLRAAGVEVVPAFAPPATFFDRILPQGAFDVALFLWAYTPADPPGEIYGCGAPQNYTGYCQRLVTAELDQADRILDDRARARVLNRADRWLASDVPTIPLYQFVFMAAYDTSVRNFVSSPGTRCGTRRTGGSSASLTRSGALCVCERLRKVPAWAW